MIADEPVGRQLSLLGEERLVRLVAEGGSDAAVREWSGRWFPRLERRARSLMRGAVSSDDVAQVTLIKAYGVLRSGFVPERFPAWVFSVLRHEVIDELRIAAAHPGGEVDVNWAALGSVEETVLERERVSELFRDMSHLPELQQRALVLRELGGLSHDEVARLLSVSVLGARRAAASARVGLHDFADGRARDCTDVQAVLGAARSGRRPRWLTAHLRFCERCAARATGIGWRDEAC